MNKNYYPLFLDLTAKPILMVGAGKIAARRLGELLASGAEITVIAPGISKPVERLAASLHILCKDYTDGDEQGFYLAFACTDNEAVNERILRNCERQRIPCSVAHDASLGSIHVPAVLRRGDVTVAVGTGGHSPGLALFLKRRIDACLGARIGDLAALLGRFRKAVHSKLSPEKATSLLNTLPYRTLYEEMENAGPTALQAKLEKLAGWTETSRQGLPAGNALHPIVLVGAGPGHPKLITIMAQEAIQKAQVIIHDRLIPEGMLDLAGSDCLIIPAGKRGGAASTRQSDIDAMMVNYARQGLRVVRLKGGDPLVFGRGWEEIEALSNAGLNWELIPGLSSTLAVPAWAGIPLTCRGKARSFAVMSGMAYSEVNVDVPKADTIVIVMGLQKLKEIMAAFIRNQWNPATSVAAIESGTLPEQRICYGTLETIESETARLAFDSPTLLVVGEVVELSKTVVAATLSRNLPGRYAGSRDTGI